MATRAVATKPGMPTKHVELTADEEAAKAAVEAQAVIDEAAAQQRFAKAAADQDVAEMLEELIALLITNSVITANDLPKKIKDWRTVRGTGS